MNCHLGGAIPHTGGSQKRASGAASAKYSFGTADVGSGQIDGVKELLDAASKFNFKGAADLLDGKFKVPDCIPVVL